MISSVVLRISAGCHLKVSVQCVRAEFGQNYISQRPSVSHNNKRDAVSSWEGRRQTGCSVKRRREEEKRRRRRGGGGEEESFPPHPWSFSPQRRRTSDALNMAKNQEVERIAKKLDKMVHKKNTVSDTSRTTGSGDELHLQRERRSFWKHTSGSEHAGSPLTAAAAAGSVFTSPLTAAAVCL